MRFTIGLSAAAVLLTVGGCTSGGATPAPAPSVVRPSPPVWTEPAKYRFVLDRKCGDRPSEGRYQVAVAAGQVVAAHRVDGRTAEGQEEIEVPTLRGLLDMARTAADDGGAVTTTLDPKDGHPTVVSIDVSDDGSRSCFVISDYATGG